MHKVFVDGQEGTTGIEIHERLSIRNDVEILTIASDKKKDLAERAKYLNEADIVFLCLPDDAAKESVSLITNPNVKVIDASTAHRVADDWDYGIAELSPAHRENIKNAKRVTNPGCHATGFIMAMYPLVKEGLVAPDFPCSCYSLTGYSGGGKKMIESYEDPANKDDVRCPKIYGLGLAHKHLPEMKKRSNIISTPIFTPIVAPFYRGMNVTTPIIPSLMKKSMSAKELHAFYSQYYSGERFVKIMPFGIETEIKQGFLSAEGCNHTNEIHFYIFGNDEQILVVAQLDNLGKGASGAAIQNMNIMTGTDEAYGL